MSLVSTTSPPMSLDAIMAGHPWAPRLIPFVVYVGLLAVVDVIRGWHGSIYPLAYVVQCGLVVWLLWRYRRLVPELTLSFHWLAVPVGVGVAAAWIWLRFWTVGAFPGLAVESDSFFDQMGMGWGWLALSLRLVGMSVVVPLFEELCMRSLMLRSLHSLRKTVIGATQFLQDVPVIGEPLMLTRWGEQASQQPPIFRHEFEAHALGRLSVFGVFASTLVFTVHHLPADWLGCVACSLAYCFLLAWTRSRGLGPTCWAHGITNALLWGYTVYMHQAGTPDWQFL